MIQAASSPRLHAPTRLRYQDAIQDVRRVFEPAEGRYFEMQAEVEKAAVGVLEARGVEGAEKFLTEYARQSTTKVGHAYHDLVDYLMFRYHPL